MRMALHVTPDARLSLRLGSSQSMQTISSHACEGNLTIEVPHSGSPTTYGSLTLREGQYTFNFEQFARSASPSRKVDALTSVATPMGGYH